VVFRQRPPRPEDLQMDPALVRVECWNQVLEAPTPATSVSTVTRSDGSVDQDTQLDFGPMQVNMGRAFAVNGAPDTRSVRVFKQYQQIGDSTWLIESVPYSELAPLLSQLPAAQARAIDRDKLKGFLFRRWALPAIIFKPVTSVSESLSNRRGRESGQLCAAQFQRDEQRLVFARQHGRCGPGDQTGDREIQHQQQDPRRRVF